MVVVIAFFIVIIVFVVVIFLFVIANFAVMIIFNPLHPLCLHHQISGTSKYRQKSNNRECYPAIINIFRMKGKAR